MENLTELIEKLNGLQITQTSEWEENIPQEIWGQYFEGKMQKKAFGLNSDEHRWYEVSTNVVELLNGFMGVRTITKTYSEQSTIEDCMHTLHFFEMEEFATISFRPKTKQ